MGGSGGGGSGKVDFPEHMKDIHHDWLNKANTHALETSMTSVMNAGLSSSPFTTAAAYDPTTDIANIITAASGLQTVISSLLSSAPVATSVGAIGTGATSMQALATAMSSNAAIADIVADIYAVNADFNPIVDSVLTGTYVNDVIDKYADGVWDKVNSTILPRFNAGMRDINAVVASSFIVGRGIIEAEALRDIGSFGSQLYLKSASDDALKLVVAKLEYNKMVSENLNNLLGFNLKFQLSSTEAIINSNVQKLTAAIEGQKSASMLTGEANRVKIVAKKEQVDRNVEIDEMDALWNIKLFQYGANLLASIGGGTSMPSTDKRSTAASAIGGALTGVASGAMVAGVPGAIVGGILGAASSLL